MSVEERLRTGLAGNAASLVPTTEVDLATVMGQARRRRRVRHVAAGLAFGAVVVAVVVGLPPLVDAMGSRSAPPGRSSLDEIPEGTYTVHVTREEARALGYTDGQIDRWYGTDGAITLTLTFHAGLWEQSADSGPGGSQEVDDRGSYRTTGTTLELVSVSPGCTSCIGHLAWAYDGLTLSLRFVAGEQHTVDERMIMEHDFSRSG